jgi:hypothetical protein
VRRIVGTGCGESNRVTLQPTSALQCIDYRQNMARCSLSHNRFFIWCTMAVAFSGRRDVTRNGLHRNCSLEALRRPAAGVAQPSGRRDTRLFPQLTYIKSCAFPALAHVLLSCPAARLCDFTYLGVVLLSFFPCEQRKQEVSRSTAQSTAVHGCLPVDSTRRVSGEQSKADVPARDAWRSQVLEHVPRGP